MTERQIPRIFSRSRIAAVTQRAKQIGAVGKAACWLSQDMANEVCERLDFMRIQPGRGLVTGHNANDLACQLRQRGCDVAAIASPEHEQPLRGDRFDLVAACASLETVNDLPGALIHIRNALADEGLFIGQLIAAGSLPALRQIMFAADGERPAARIHPQIDNRSATALMERAGFRRQVVDSRRLTVRYSSLARLIGDLREQALTSVLLSPAPYVGKAGLARAQATFEALRDQDGKVSETFEIITLTGWR